MLVRQALGVCICEYKCNLLIEEHIHNTHTVREINRFRVTFYPFIIYILEYIFEHKLNDSAC